MVKLVSAVLLAVSSAGCSGLALATAAYAAQPPRDACSKAPAPVTAAVEPGWALLRLEDLNSDDQKLWLGARPRSCPGYAAANMGAGSGPSYIVALIDKRTAKAREKVVLLVPNETAFAKHTLAKPAPVGNPAVVWRAPPGKYHEWDASHSITIRNDSVVLETMETSAVQYYFDGGRLRSLTTSD